MMFRCEYPDCGAEYTSALSAAICEDEDRERDATTRSWSKRYDFHRKD